MENPKPAQILYSPSAGELKYLFIKKKVSKNECRQRSNSGWKLKLGNYLSPYETKYKRDW